MSDERAVEARIRVLKFSAHGDVLVEDQDSVVPHFLCCVHQVEGGVGYRLRSVCRHHRLLPTGTSWCNLCGLATCRHVTMPRHAAEGCRRHTGVSSLCCPCFSEKQIRSARTSIFNSLAKAQDEERVRAFQVTASDRQPSTPCAMRGKETASVTWTIPASTDMLARRVFPATSDLRFSQVAGFTCLLGSESPTGCSVPGILSSRGLLAPKQFCVVQGNRPLPTVQPTWPAEGGVCTISPEGYRTYSVLAAGVGCGLIRVPSGQDDVSGDLCSPEIVLGSWSGRGLPPNFEVWRCGKRGWSIEYAAIFAALCTTTHAYECHPSEIDFSGNVLVAATAIAVVAACLHLAGKTEAREIALKSSTGPVELMARRRLAAGGISTSMSISRPPSAYFTYARRVKDSSSDPLWVGDLMRILARHLPQAVALDGVYAAPQLFTRCERFAWNVVDAPRFAVVIRVPVSFCPHTGGRSTGARNARRAFAACGELAECGHLTAPFSDGVCRPEGFFFLPAWATVTPEECSYFGTLVRLSASTGDLRHSDGISGSRDERYDLPDWCYTVRDVWATSSSTRVHPGKFTFRRDAIPPRLEASVHGGVARMERISKFPEVDEFFVGPEDEEDAYESALRAAEEPEVLVGKLHPRRKYVRTQCPVVEINESHFAGKRGYSLPADHRRLPSRVSGGLHWSDRKRSGASVNMIVSDGGLVDPLRLVRRESHGSTVGARSASGCLTALRAVRFILATPSYPKDGYREAALTDYVGEYVEVPRGDLGGGYEARKSVPNVTKNWPTDGRILPHEIVRLSLLCAENVQDLLSPTKTLFDFDESEAPAGTIRSIADLTGEDYDAATRLLGVTLAVCGSGMVPRYAAEILQWISLPALLGGHRWRKKLASFAHIAMITGDTWRGIGRGCLLNAQRQLTRGIFLGSPSQLVMSVRPTEPVTMWRGRQLPDFAVLFRTACEQVLAGRGGHCSTCLQALTPVTRCRHARWLCRSCSCRSLKLLNRGGGTLAFTRGEGGMHAAALAYEAEVLPGRQGPIDTVERFLSVLYEALHDPELKPVAVRFPVWPNGQAGSREQECPGVLVGLSGILLRAVFSRLIDDDHCLPMREPNMAPHFSGLSGKDVSVLAADATAATERQSHESLAIMAGFSSVHWNGVDLVPLALTAYTKYTAYEMRGDEWSVRAQGAHSYATSEVLPTAYASEGWVVALPSGAKRL